MEKIDFQNVEFEQNTLKSAKCYYFFAKGFISKILGFPKKADAKKCGPKFKDIKKNPDAKKVWTKILG